MLLVLFFYPLLLLVGVFKTFKNRLFLGSGQGDTNISTIYNLVFGTP